MKSIQFKMVLFFIIIISFISVGTQIFAVEIECFIAGTEILMGDGSIKVIEDITIGEQVLTVNTDTFNIESKSVTNILSQYHTGEGTDFTIRIAFSDGTTNQNTNTHPYWIDGKGWASYLPDLTYQYYGLSTERLSVNDTVYKYNDGSLIKVSITSIIEIREPVQTYNLMGITDNYNFFANGILVHNKGGDPPPPPPPPEPDPDPEEVAAKAAIAATQAEIDELKKEMENVSGPTAEEIAGKISVLYTTETLL